MNSLEPEMSNMNKDELDRRLLVNEQSRSAENLDQLRALAEKYGWTNEEFIRERDRRFPTQEEMEVEHYSPSFEEPTGVFDQYLHHLNLQDWGEEVVESIKNEVEETYQRMMVKSQLIKKAERAGYGLIVGRIQSGKTAHMLGLSFRAMDSSLHDIGEQYDTVIIMSGLLEDLRKQTLSRLQKTEIDDILFLPQNSDFSSKNQQAKEEQQAKSFPKSHSKQPSFSKISLYDPNVPSCVVPNITLTQAFVFDSSLSHS